MTFMPLPQESTLAPSLRQAAKVNGTTTVRCALLPTMQVGPA